MTVFCPKWKKKQDPGAAQLVHNKLQMSCAIQIYGTSKQKLTFFFAAF